jgi:Spy/CpxP family protein refolding chaperone
MFTFRPLPRRAVGAAIPLRRYSDAVITALASAGCFAFLVLAPPAAADQSLATALSLSIDQAHEVKAIESKYRLEFAAKRGDFNRESRELRRARIASDRAAIARQEPVVAALQEDLRKIRDAENEKIRALLTPAQRIRFDAVLAQRKAMRGSSRDERVL